MTIKKIPAVIIVTTLLIIAEASYATNFTIAISGGGPSGLNLRLAEGFGFYGTEGLNVRIITLPGGTRSLQVLLARDIEVITAGLGPVAQANEKNAGVRMVAVARSKVPFVIFSNPKVKTGADLKGGTIGISSFGSEPDIAVTRALRQMGLTRKDVTIVQMSENTERMKALLAGSITATPLAEPNVSKARDMGLVPLVDLTTSDDPWIFTSVVVRQDYLKQNADVLKKFMRANVETSYFALSNEKATKESIASIFKISDPKLINIYYDDYVRTPRFAEVSRKGAENVLKEIQAMGRVSKVNVDDHIDHSPFESLRKDGFIEKMRRKYGIKETGNEG